MEQPCTNLLNSKNLNRFQPLLNFLRVTLRAEQGGVLRQRSQRVRAQMEPPGDHVKPCPAVEGQGRDLSIWYLLRRLPGRQPCAQGTAFAIAGEAGSLPLVSDRPLVNLSCNLYQGSILTCEKSLITTTAQRAASSGCLLLIPS